MIACITAIVLLTVVSFFGGRFLLYGICRAESGCCASMAAGSVLLFFGVFLLQVLVVMKELPFFVMKWGTVWYALILVICGCIFSRKSLHGLRRKLSTGNLKEMTEGQKRRRYLLVGSAACIFALNVCVMLWYEPYFGNDMTVEEVNTILTTGTVCRYHPGTGARLELGMNAEAKLNFMPGLYAVLCDVTGADPYLLICRFVPVWGLLLNYAVISLLLGKVYGGKKDRNRIVRAMILYGVLLLFGDYQAYSYAFRLLHQGWNPYVILWASVLPLVLVCVIHVLQAAYGYRERRKSKHAECVE